jgi:hypothetical protein
VALGDATALVDRGRQTTLPATIVGSFQGTAQAFQDSLTGHRRDPADGDLRDLHRPGDPVRELHPSDHDPFGTAVRRTGRARQTLYDLPRRSQPRTRFVGVIMLVVWSRRTAS